MAALRAACAGGTVDAIATDHAPHPPERKDATLDAAPPGMLGLETALAVALDALGAHPGRNSDAAAPSGDDAHGSGDRRCRCATSLGLLSWRPARIAGLARDQGGDQGGPIEPGAPANICVIDPDATLGGRSRSGWPAGAGTRPGRAAMLTGQVRHTVFRGEPVVVDARGPAMSPTATTTPDGRWSGGREPALLVLADGEVFEGEAIGAAPARRAWPPASSSSTRCCRGTRRSSPTPATPGQVIAFTYPHIGNYGVTADDDEAPRPWCRGVVVRDLPPRPS